MDISKIEAGKITLNDVPFGLITLVEDVVRMLADNARAKGLALNTQIDYSISDFLLGDPERIRQVLINLLGNAIKFTDKGSVSVEASVEEVNENEVKVKICVKDTGIGISEENTRQLFQPFSQLDNSSGCRFGGTGLGLSISKTIVELMGGQIFVQSTLGQGSIFSFSLPLKKLGQKLQGHKPPSNGNSNQDTLLDADLVANKLVMVVEDNHMLRDLAMKQLSMIGFKAVQAFSTGTQAVEAAKESTFDLILMDCHLPEMDGFEATREIRQIDAIRGLHTPIVAMTASCIPEELNRCIDNGMDDYLMKPVTISKLKGYVRKWLVLR